MNVREEYIALLNEGGLKEMYPSLSGDWIKDKATFTQLWRQNQEALMNLDVDFEEFGDEEGI